MNTAERGVFKNTMLHNVLRTYAAILLLVMDSAALRVGAGAAERGKRPLSRRELERHQRALEARGALDAHLGP